MIARSELERPASASHLPALDGLRLVCCTWVVVGHAFVGHELEGFMSRLTGAGVEVFFALSGFLITRILLAERERTGRVDLFKFYMRRTLRIWPVYYLAIAVAVVGILVLGARFTQPLGANLEEVDTWQIAWRYGLFVANVAPTPVPTSLEVLWSICVEEQFYLLFPILWVRANRPSPVVRVVAVALVIAWATRVWLANVDAGLIYRNPIAHADHLLLGSLLAQLAHTHGRTITMLARRAGPLADAVTLGLLMLVVAWRTAPGAPAIEWWAHYLVSALLCTSLVGLLAFGDGVLAGLLSRPSAAFLGTLTYAGYVFHIYPLAVAWFVVHRLVPGSALEIPLRAVVATVGTFVVAYASKRLLEDRVLALKSRFS